MILIARKYTKFDHIKNAETRNRHHARTNGSYVLDLADLKKTVVLCELCRRKFKARGYRPHKTIPRVQGQCDACKNLGVHTMFVHDSFNY